MRSRSRPRKSRDEERQDIIAGAHEAFATHGYMGASTDLLVKATGRNRYKLYCLFGSKAQIFETVAVEALSLACTELKRGACSPEDLHPVYLRLGLSSIIRDVVFIRELQTPAACAALEQLGQALITHMEGDEHGTAERRAKAILFDLLTQNGEAESGEQLFFGSQP
ncbi:MAG: helix-turn-helix domain-containing protein [Pseudomonadota bacterium]